MLKLSKLKDALFLIISLFSILAIAKSSSDLLSDCLASTDSKVCDKATSHLAGLANYKDALVASERACDLNNEDCGQSYFLALDIGVEMTDKILNKMISRCNRNILVCDELASIYEHRKEFDMAIETAQKYYKKFEKGVYPSLLSKYRKDKKLEFETSLDKCRRESDSCYWPLRNMPDHPNYTEILQGAEYECKNNVIKNIFGGSSCAIVGNYYYKINDYQKAYEHWAFDCVNNVTSCLFILGSKKFDSEKNYLAMKYFCAKNRELLYGPYEKLRKANCSNLSEIKFVPPAILNYAVAELNGYQQEQK